MSLWKTRTASINYVESTWATENQILQDTFQLLDESIGIFAKGTEKSTFSQVCGLTVVKARQLALGCYSLSLDGLGQEAGALLRPLVETFELLLYFREDPARCEQVFNNTVPSAGKIGQLINGKFKLLRDYLNDNASHFSFNDYSVQHLIDWNDVTFKATLPFDEVSLKRNLATMFAFLILVTIEAINCLDTAGLISDDSLQRRAEECRSRGLEQFRPVLDFGKI